MEYYIAAAHMEVGINPWNEIRVSSGVVPGFRALVTTALTMGFVTPDDQDIVAQEASRLAFLVFYEFFWRNEAGRTRWGVRERDRMGQTWHRKDWIRSAEQRF